ncbi:MAG TPA: Crp/Fnr family transcriptional regulator [Vicinamibacterales bacterium]|jgi:CRP-like cAMP-binding protein|nr:Crp/Fnr family transcriptional regulator [Vicinamibacterales bacterium]
MTAGTQLSPSLHSPNRLLARLPSDDYQRLVPHLQTVSLQPRDVLLQAHVPTRRVYFLGGGACSILLSTADGEAAGVALIGNEGFIGLSAIGGDSEARESAVLEIAEGDAQAMDVEVFRREMDRRSAFTDLMHRYIHAFIQSLMQSVLCNALHSIEKRCAKCLLEISDRLGRSDFPLTQDALAAMLGVRRASITLAEAALHRAGLIEHRHRRVVIRDPSGLEAASCECYGVVKGHLARPLL